MPNMSELPGEASFLDCGLAVVHPWLCDVMGHLTTRHYLGMFDDAAYQLFAALDYRPEVAREQGWGWADVRQEIEYLNELQAGDLVRIDGRVGRLGRSSVDLEYRLFDRSRGRLSATLKATTICFDLNLRRSRVLPQDWRAGVKTNFPNLGAEA